MATATRSCLLTVMLVLLAGPAESGSEADFAALRQYMVAEIEADARLTSSVTGKETLDARVMEVMGKVPRHAFVPEKLEPLAYLNQPLPIGHGQTVSQPYIVALMTDLARIGPDDKVLEIGIGGGYHAAVLAELAHTVYIVELIEPVAETAMERLVRLDYDNIETRVGDGYFGWQARGPFDAVIMRQAVDHIPPPLINQLKPGGRLVIPVGPPLAVQQLTLVEKLADGRVKKTRILPVRFTTLPGGQRI